MASDTQIANRALSKLGEERILGLNDATKGARELNSMYTMVRDAELRRYRWKFAIRRVSLPALVDAPEFGFAYQYPVPSDFLGLVQVNEFYLRSGTKDKGPWSLEQSTDGTQRVILTDINAPLVIRYQARIENPALFDPLFVEMFACKLAFEACEAITQSSTKKDAISKEYDFALKEAVRCDAVEGPPDELPWGSWLDSREGPNIGLSGDAGIYGAAGYEVL